MAEILKHTIESEKNKPLDVEMCSKDMNLSSSEPSLDAKAATKKKRQKKKHLKEQLTLDAEDMLCEQGHVQTEKVYSLADKTHESLNSLKQSEQINLGKDLELTSLLCMNCLGGVQLNSKEPLDLKRYQQVTKDLLEKDVNVFATHICLTSPHPPQSLKSNAS